MLTQEYVKSILDYDPITGIFTWKYRTDLSPNYIERWNDKFAGKMAGCVNNLGYIIISIHGEKCLTHRLAWFYVYGYWPVYVDHKHGDISDNRIDQLREATQIQNSANSYKTLKGVEAHGSKYRARLSINRIRMELGSFDTYEEAQLAYNEASDKYHGEYATINRYAK